MEGFASPDLFVRAGPPPLITTITSPAIADQLFLAYQDVDDDQRLLWSVSRSRDVNLVPLTTTDAHGRAVHGDGREATYIPEAILPHNISGNVGLLRNLQDLQRLQAELKSYMPLLSDVNIFRRLLRVRPYADLFCFDCAQHLVRIY